MPWPDEGEGSIARSVAVLGGGAGSIFHRGALVKYRFNAVGGRYGNSLSSYRHDRARVHYDRALCLYHFDSARAHSSRPLCAYQYEPFRS